MYASHLEQEGLVVCEAAGPRGALRAIRRFHPDVLVTDYRGCAQPAIVVVSGYTRPEDERRARAAGADPLARMRR
jgi:CheY-like chemotaxis protein